MPRSSSGLHSRVVNALGEEIVNGALEPGAILDLDAFALRFAVSRSVLREALRVLESLGMVEPRQRVGTQVLPRGEWDLMNPQLILWRGRGDEYFVQMRELLELRLGIEPVAARLGASAMSDSDAAAIGLAAEAMGTAAAARDGRAYVDADVAFHTAILRGSGNAVFTHFATTVEALLRTRTSERRFTITDYTPASAQRHSELAGALVERDADGAFRRSYELIDATHAEFVREARSPATVSPPHATDA